jgi:hypothetical protein
MSETLVLGLGATERSRTVRKAPRPPNYDVDDSLVALLSQLRMVRATPWLRGSCALHHTT